MPSNTLGFTGQEIVSRVVSYVGNTKLDFQTYVEQTLPLAEFRFAKAHDWRFLHKQNLPLAVTNGTSVYTLNTGNIGYNMAAEDVENIWDDTNGRLLFKTTLKDLRRVDPKHDDGTATDEIVMWAPVNDNDIEVYPPIFESVTLRVDGKITPNALSTLSNYPTVPYKYQEAFIEYVIALALDRENDDRASSKKAEAIELIKMDIRNDMSSLGDTENPRLRFPWEAWNDGIGGNPEQAWLNYLFRW